MNKNSQLVAVRCVCGKKFRVRQKSQNAVIACPACGNTINLSATSAVEKIPEHWAVILLKAVWAIPVCIAVAGILLIVFKERSEPTVEKVAVETTRVDPTTTSKTESDRTTKVLFPGEGLHLPKDLAFIIGESNGLIGVTANAIFRENEGKLTTSSDDVAAVQLVTLVDHFELDLLGKFGSKGGLYFLVGWDLDTQTGYMVKYSRLVNYAHWMVHYIRDGKPVRFPTPIVDAVADDGKLSVMMKGKSLSVSISGKPILQDLFLEEYRPGQVILGTWHNKYRGKALEISQILMTSKFDDVETSAPVDTVEVKSPLKNILLQQIFPGREFNNIQDFSFHGTGPFENYRSTGRFEIAGDQLRGKRSVSAALDLVENTEDFEMTLTGDFIGRGVMFFPIGWNLATKSGYLLAYNRLIHSAGWSIEEVENGELKRQTHVDNFRIEEAGTLSIKVEDQNLSVSYGEHEVTDRFYLPRYQSGSVLIGTAPNQYEGSDLVIDAIHYRDSK